MTSRESIYYFVRQIPEGRVATYGQIARLIASPRAARQVGFALRALGLKEQAIPWWRVVNKQGYISINHGDGGIEKEVQKNLLESEKIICRGDFTIDLDIYLWKPQLDSSIDVPDLGDDPGIYP